MISNLENAMAKQTEQATVQATGMESINNGMKPQGIATPDSNCISINEKETSIGDPEQPVLKTDKKTPVPINDIPVCMAQHMAEQPDVTAGRGGKNGDVQYLLPPGR